MNIEKVIYTVESRKTKTNDFISDSVYENLEKAREYFNKLVDDKKNYKGETILLIKQTYAFDKEENELADLLDEDFIEEIEL